MCMGEYPRGLGRLGIRQRHTVSPIFSIRLLLSALHRYLICQCGPILRTEIQHVRYFIDSTISRSYDDGGVALASSYQQGLQIETLTDPTAYFLQATTV